MADILGLEGPEELEELAFRRISEGKIREGLKLVLRAAKKYEEEGNREDAARLYRYLGYVLLEKTGDVEKARPSLLKSAYLYIDLIEDEISKPKVNIDLLDTYSLSVLEVFSTLGDDISLSKYAKEFAAIYHDLGKTYEELGDVSLAIKAYESVYWYYKMAGNEENAKKAAEILITLYGQKAEDYLSNGNSERAAEAFYNLAKFTWAIFDYDIHFIEMMDTAAKNFEKASKIAYSQGNLDGTTTNLVKAQYAYLLAKNFNRSKLIGINAAKMLNQLIATYRAEKNYEATNLKLLELYEALAGVGKFEEALKAYKLLLENESSIELRIRVRLAVIKYFIAKENHHDLFEDVTAVEFHLSRGRHSKAMEIAERSMMKKSATRKLLSELHRAEGIG